tara:strand:- start:263 stop:1282 length:1020 start_codon:yes stop_codon:yes gene_type:complete
MSLSVLMKLKKVPNKKNFILLGIMLGLAFLSKYAAVYFVLCVVLYFLLDKKFRELIKKNYMGVLLSISCLFIVVLPNFIWNISNNWVTLLHTSDNANFENLDLSLERGVIFLIIQILMIGPFLFFANIINFKNVKINSNKKILLIFSLPVFLIVFIEAVIVRANANWAAPALLSLFLFLYISSIDFNSIYMKLNIGFNFIFCLLFFLLVGTTHHANFLDRIRGLNSYSSSILLEADKLNIKDLVISDRLLFASFNYELRAYKDKDSLSFHMPHKPGGRITNHFQMTSPLKKEMDKDFIFIGNSNDIKYLENDFTCKKKELRLRNDKKNKFKKDFEICYY